jgi:hypothetical protein|tara:strand:+ start:18 stop:296 length:279 start_codon:yes stop_codon:yes gene_type:complete
MKKLLSIIFVSFLLSVNIFAEEKKYKYSDKYIKEKISKLTLADVMNKAASLEEITSNEDGVQYHFIIRYDDVDGIVPVVCFVSSKSTTCRVP